MYFILHNISVILRLALLYVVVVVVVCVAVVDFQTSISNSGPRAIFNVELERFDTFAAGVPQRQRGFMIVVGC